VRRLLGALLVLLAPPALAQSFGDRWHYTEQGGEAVYRGVCAACHMPDGRGAVGAGAYPSLAADPALADADAVMALVRDGRRAMPGFAGTLSEAQIAAVVGFIRTHFGNDFAAGANAQEVAGVRR
jgi:mono/diheme cytochrome c family protein